MLTRHPRRHRCPRVARLATSRVTPAPFRQGTVARSDVATTSDAGYRHPSARELEAGHAAVDRERRARGGPGERAAEVGDRVRDLVGGDQAAHGLAGARAGRGRRRGRGGRRAAGRPTGCPWSPGSTALTRMPSRAWSAAMARVMRERRRPCSRRRGPGWARPSDGDHRGGVDDAACAERRRCGSAARVTRATPTTLMSSTRCHSSSSLAVTSPAAPIPGVVDDDVEAAELARPPRSTAASTDAASATSHATPRAAAPGSPGCRSSTATRAPARRQQRDGGRADPAGAPGDQGDEALVVAHALLLTVGRLRSRGSMWILGPDPAPARSPPAEDARRPAARPDGGGHQRTRVDPAVGVALDGAVEARRGAEDAHGGHVLEHEVAGVDAARRPGEPDEHDPSAGLDESEGERPARRRRWCSR